MTDEGVGDEDEDEDEGDDDSAGGAGSVGSIEASAEGETSGADASTDGDAPLATSRSRIDMLTSVDADPLGVALGVSATGDCSRASLEDALGDGVASTAMDDVVGDGDDGADVGVGVDSGGVSNDVLTHRSGTPSGEVEAAAAGCAESRGATRRAHDNASATALTRWDLTMLSLRRGRGEWRGVRA